MVQEAFHVGWENFHSQMQWYSVVESSLELPIDGTVAKPERSLIEGSIICLCKGLGVVHIYGTQKLVFVPFLLAPSVALCSFQFRNLETLAIVVIGTEFSKIVEPIQNCCPQGSKIGCFDWWYYVYELVSTVVVCYPSSSLACGLVVSAQVIVFFCGCLSDPVRICAATVNGHKNVGFPGSTPILSIDAFHEESNS